MFPSPFARRFGIKSAPFATNNTGIKGTKLPKSETVIRKLSFAPLSRAALSLLIAAQFLRCRGRSSLVTAVRFLNGQEVLSIDYSGAKYAHLALPVLRDVITSVSSKNSHKAPLKPLGHLRLRELRRQPLQNVPQKAPQSPALKTPVNCPHCGQKWRLRRRLRRQPFILLSFSSSKKLQKAQETQPYQRFQHVGHTAFNTSGTNGHVCFHQ